MKNKLNITLLCLSFLILIVDANSQNMLGFSKADVQKQMTSNFSKFSPSSFGISTNMNTLKYIDSKNDRTLIFYFDKSEKCEYSKMIEDMESFDARIKEFNGKYKTNGNLKWIDVKNGKNYNVRIEKEEYIFNVITSN